MNQKERYSIAFYNLENFFDTKDDPATDDDAFTPKGIMHWIKKRYFNKSKKIGYAISQIGLKETGRPPLLVGLSEVENKQVLTDLLQSKHLKNINYGFVHYESGDRRGMDVALLYHKDYCEILESKAYPLELYTNEGKAYKTRDVLYVKLLVFNQIVHILVNHWPSRREGDFKSQHKRHLAGQSLQETINYLMYEEHQPYIVVMGDFNTDPNDEVIRQEILPTGFFNPSEQVSLQKKGSLNHQKRWHLFDQIILSNVYGDSTSKHRFQQFDIFMPLWLKVWKGKLKGTPFRTYFGKKYQAGYSDHFPVYVVVVK